MPKGSENLSHEEIWDDSALIDSWNEALDEYKKYHSIRAKGGSLKDLEELSKAQYVLQSQETEPQETWQMRSTIMLTTSFRETKLADDTQDVMDEEDTAEAGDQGVPLREAPKEVPSNSAAQPPSLPITAVLGSMRDENLKRLLMSWYYAGYYTGLHEGQQQAQQQST